MDFSSAATYNEIVRRTQKHKHCGLDMFTFRLDAYLDPKYNARTDEYGGSTENKLRLSIKVFKAIKENLGDNFLVEAINFGGKDHAGDKGVSNEELREAGVKMKLGVTGVFQDPAEIDQILADSIDDIVVVGCGFLFDYEYGKKIAEGRAEDIHPCIRCNRCHMYSANGPEMHYCTVNPIFYMQSRIGHMTDHVVTPKKVAVIGGGPADMEAAIVAQAQGHQVTIFEMNDVMGGQLLHADHCDFKWSYKNYKDYLIRQVEKSGAEIRLNIMVP